MGVHDRHQIREALIYSAKKLGLGALSNREAPENFKQGQGVHTPDCCVGTKEERVATAETGSLLQATSTLAVGSVL